MDTKTLAKSKRAHSLHHSKKSSHPHPKPKPASAGAGSSKTASEKMGQLRRTPATPDLPSNWERYEEELDSDAEAAVPSHSSEVPLPKSKGADYRHLIAEAKSQPQLQSDPYLDSFPYMADVLPDFFYKGASALLSARGEAVVSMAKDHNFDIEDKATGSHEAPFLSLNLNLLAEKLAKVDLAKRLFIEEDLVPPEMAGPVSLTNASASSSESVAATEHLGDSNWDDSTKNEEIRGSKSQKPTFAVNQVTVNPSQRDPHSRLIVSEPTKQSPANTMAEPRSKPSSFKAAAAEAELDALLDSLNETKLTDKFDLNTSRSALSSEGKSSKASLEVPKKFSESSKAVTPPSSTNIDDLLDDLLEETSKLTKKQNGLGGGAAESSAPSISSKSKVLDDFDSWLDTI